jgi:hypothetical protein
VRAQHQSRAALATLLGIVLLATGQQAGAQTSAAAPGDLRYDSDYPFMGYSKAATDNPIARLQARLDRGEIRLAARGPRGYLDALLAALNIDASSQALVFSKSSLQVESISAATPRALYFNDDTYIGWVQNGSIEIATLDGALGPVFYTLRNDAGGSNQFQRETQRCLSCHDTFSLAGGGVPRFLFQSAFARSNDEVVTDVVAAETTDKTPLEDRWGGWYVTGRQGALTHLGNIFKDPSRQPVNLQKIARGNLTTLSGLFDTAPYLTDKSDIVALLVFEHQVYVHDLISRANYKTRWLMSRPGREGADSQASWDQLSQQTQTAFKPMLEQLVQAMLFIGAAPLPDGIASTSGFDVQFQARGPVDSKGRSLRTLALKSRLFRYPLSFLVYSVGFDHLPPGAKDYVYDRFAAILSGRDSSDVYRQIPPELKEEMLQILTDTKPDFAHREVAVRTASTR